MKMFQMQVTLFRLQKTLLKIVEPYTRERVQDVKAYPAPGTVVPGTAVTLSTETPDATVYYTTDGTTPTETSTKYTSPITINEAVSIKAIAVKAGLDNSEISSFNYNHSKGCYQYS